MKLTEQDALIVVDVQNDFCPGGALPVPGGDGVVPPINNVIMKFGLVIYSRDWHPSDHCSFSDEPAFVDMDWPPHCVQNTPGAEFHGDLLVPLDAYIVSKGITPEKEAYSAFQGTDLAADLQARGIKRIFVAGLATDYCVKATALDALKEDFATVVLEDASRGIADDTVAAALQDMKTAGITITTTRDINDDC